MRKPHPPTLSDVAREAGVSRSAAARVLLGTGGEHVRVGKEARQAIVVASEKLNYTPNRNAQQLRGASSNTIGVIVDTVNTRVMGERLFAIEKVASERGYRILVGRVTGDYEQLNDYVSDFISRGVEAILCLFDLEPGRDPRAKKAFFRRFKNVAFHGRAAWHGGYAVQIDVASAIRAAVDHLVARGKTRPGLALWNAARDELMEIRRKAFAEALDAHGLSPSPQQVWDAASDSAIPDGATLDRGVDALVIGEGVDAILASNDIWAVRFIQTLKERGYRVPDDVALIGYDDLDIAAVIEPSLSTVNPNHEAYANASLDLLLKMVRGGIKKVRDRTVIITPKLILRQSS